MTPQPRTKPQKKKPATLADLIDRLDRQAVVIEAMTRSIQLLVRENQRLIDVLIEGADQGEEGEEPGRYMDGTRIS